MIRSRIQFRSPFLVTAAALAFAATPAPADILGPYLPDASTLHLWHLDEADPGPAAGIGNGTTFDLTPGNGAFLGATAFAGFGTAADTTAATNAGMQGTTIPASDLTGADGAFTIEAMIRTSETAAVQQIIGMDAAGANANRPFQFRIDAGQLRFINIGGSTVEQILTLIPTTGPDAFVANEWFHAAVTYNGNENTADNIKLYWTRVDASRTQANEILSMTMLEDLAGSATFGAGNEYRAAADNNLLGQIDEVRVSDIARAPDEMLFGIVGPDTTPPALVDTNPGDDATNVLVSTNLVANFDEIITAGTGAITLWKNADPDELVETFDVTSSPQLAFSVGTLTIDPTSDLVGGVEYYVLIDATAITDTATNPYPGISDPTAWSFTADGTAPAGNAMGPMADATEVSPRSDLTLTFSENVQAGTGDITVHLAGDDSVVQTIDVASGAVTINGAEVTIDLSQLAGATAYYINIPAGAFTDPSGNAYAGITDTTTWAFTTAAIPEGLLFAEDFAGPTEDLDGSTPDTTTGGAAWVAAPVFNQDGSNDQGPGSATLAFTPFDGLVYGLEASITGISGDGDWFALGFVNGQSNISSTNDRFITGNAVGAAWMLMKGDASTSQNSAFLGLGTLGGGNHGLTSNEAWTVWTNENPGGDIDLRIVLDTTGGPGAWTATWYAKRPADGTYTEVRPTTLMLTESFNAVGLALSNDGVFGTIESFRLYTGAPPADAPLVLEIAENGGLLDFAWNSMSGMQYDLVSSADPATETDPAAWPPYNDGVTTHENIKSAGATTTLPGVMKDGTTRFFALVEEPIPPLFSEDFDSGDGGFTVVDHSGGTGTLWVHGDPDSTGDGGAVTTGNGESLNCWGTNIGNPGIYLTGTDTSLISPVIDLSSVTGATLSFAQAIDILSPDSLTVNIIEADISGGISVIGGPVHTADDSGTTTEANWKQVSGLDLAAGVGQQVRLEWRFTGNGDGTYMGAYIDDVVVTETTP